MNLTIYTDGSYNEQRKVYGGGVVILGIPGDNEYITAKICGSNKDFVQHRNISGEILAVLKAMEIVSTLKDVDRIDIYHDYNGVRCWVTGEWQAKKAISQLYTRVMKGYVSKYNIRFHHVKGHSGDFYNNMADRLARDATMEGFTNNA